jgi:GTP-binding protein EngB required for normal cell division
MENLTQKLQLNPDQQAKLKPIAEQEVGYLEEIQLNPVLSKKDKLKKLNAVLHNSDERMKPVLTSDQWEKLQLMRSEQKSELEKLAKAPATTGEKP